MNNPSPLLPQGSLLEQKNKSRARVRLYVFFVLSIHVVGLTALLMQGCRKPAEPIPVTETNPPPNLETSAPPETALPPTSTLPTESVVPPTVAPTPAPPQVYTVAKGDSFYTIAKNFGVTIKAIQEANPGVEPTKLQIGQKLQIPSAPAPPPAGVTPGAVEMSGGGLQVYTVKSGDTLTSIATQFHTTVKALRSENELTTDKIKVGQKLKIPAASSAPAPSPVAPTTTVPAPTTQNPTQ